MQGTTSLISEELLLGFCRGRFGDHLHDKRVRSLAYGALGVMYADELSVAGVGRGMARARGTSPKHGIKQVDRLLSNDGVPIEACFAGWVPWLVGDRDAITVALDWTEHARDGQSTICAYLVSRHGRATPLVWMTVETASLKNNRNRFEDELLSLLKEKVPPDVEVTVLADRGFGDTGLYEFLEELRFKYVIRFRGIIQMRTEAGAHGAASEFLGPAGRPTRYDNVELTRGRQPVPGVVTVHEDGMKEAWYLATNRPDSAEAIVKLYGRRFTIEETFRDNKDPHFGMGLSQTHIGEPARRDRLLMLAAIAHALLTLVGRAGESIGLDRGLRANTETRRTHSLFRQGREYLRGAFSKLAGELQRTIHQLLYEHSRQTEVYGWL
jgi:hypothetical protein